MKLLEIEGKKLFKKAGVNIPRDVLISSKKDLSKVFAPCIVKAQVLFGRRGKQGLVKKVKTVREAKALVKNLFKRRDVFGVLCEKIVPVEKEYYLSLIVDRVAKDVIGIFSDKGGIDIEEVARKFPHHIVKFSLSELNKIKVKEKRELKKVVHKLYALMKKVDAELVELNPLAVTKKGLVALDAKVVIDDNALYRQKQFMKLEKRELTGLELEAAHHGLHYVDLDGNIGVIGDGAGLVMATLDVLDHYDGKPANFLDVGGGANEKQMEQALRLILHKKIKGLFINIFGGITHCDEIAEAIAVIKKKMKLKLPIVVRLAGTNVKGGEEIIRAAGIEEAQTMDEGVKTILKRVK